MFKINLKNFTAGTRSAGRNLDEKARKVMKDVKNYTLGEAKERAPILTGHLTMDISGEVVVGSGDYAAVIFVPANAPSAPYAIKMHETIYKLGPESEAKQAKGSVTVGTGFMWRALQENVDTIRTIAIEGLNI